MRDIVGGYRLVGHLASGGMAEVYLARPVRERGGAPVALKCLRPPLARDRQQVLAFQDEARVLGELSHPSIVRAVAAGEDRGTHFIALEYVRGFTLSALLERLRERRLLPPLPAVAVIADDLLSALHAAHEARDRGGRPLRVVHRDVSPQNVILQLDGTAKLTDFGVARYALQAHVSTRGTLRGKTAYVSPEQLLSAELDPRADIWAAAVVLYELLTLRHPLLGCSEVETLRRIAVQPIPALRTLRPDAPEALEKVIGLALRRPADRRLENAATFREALLLAQPPEGGRRALGRLLRTCFPEGPAAPEPVPPGVATLPARFDTRSGAPTELVAVDVALPPEEPAPRIRRDVLVALAGAALASGLAWAIQAIAAGARP